MLVTGGGGFAGRHLVRHLRQSGVPVDAPKRSELDLLDPAAARSAVAGSRPKFVYHLAALASVSRSLSEPRQALEQNLRMTLNLLEAVRSEAPDVRLLVTSSGEVYGRPERLPVDEKAVLRPQNPYAVAKAACDLLAGQFADAHGMGVIRTRAFNHAGPGQGGTYVLGSFASQVAQAEAAGADELVIRTGNLESARDFTDVRDVVGAYVAAISLPAGIYNVCSGRSVSVRQLLKLVANNTALTIRQKTDPTRVREGEVREIRGSANRLHGLTGWQPSIPLARTVAETLEAARRQVRCAGRGED